MKLHKKIKRIFKGVNPEALRISQFNNASSQDISDAIEIQQKIEKEQITSAH